MTVTYRRINAKRVKKWAAGAGLAGIPLIALLFMFLASPELGAINIINCSGDMNCNGTPDDLCYAICDFECLTDTYIYPNESWYFVTDIPIKSVKLQRSWGDSWRTIDLTKTWSKLVKYSIKFSAGKNYTIRFVAEKYSPYDTVKWTWGDLNLTNKVIDPYWYPNVYICSDGLVNESWDGVPLTRNSSCALTGEEYECLQTYGVNNEFCDIANAPAKPEPEPKVLVSRIYNANGYVDTYSDGTKTIDSGHKTYLSWDGTYHSKSDMNLTNDLGEYYIREYTNYYKVWIGVNDSFNMPIIDTVNFKTEYSFEEKRIKEYLHVLNLQGLVERSVVHNATVRYIPLPWSPSVAFSQVGNALSLGDWRTGDFWIRDNSSFTNENGTFVNYSYYDVENHYKLIVVNGEIRLYFDDLAWFQNAVYPLVIDPTWITNSTTGWNGDFDQTIEYGNGRIKLNHNQTDLEGWWDFSEGTGSIAYDYTTNNNDGTLHNMEEGDWSSGKYGQGLNFGGTDEYVEKDVQLFSDFPFTLCAFFNMSDVTSDGAIFSIADPTDTDIMHGLRVYDDEAGLFTRESASFYFSGGAVTDNQWHHVCGVFVGDLDKRVFVDGVNVINRTSDVAYFSSPRFSIGRVGDSSPGMYMNGRIDEVMGFNRSLSSKEINVIKDGQVRYLIGNYTELDYDCGDGNIAQNISVHFFNSSTNTKMNIYVNMSTDNSTWDNSYTLVQAGALNATEYDIASGERYLKYRTELNSTTGAETDEMYEVRVECVVSAADTTAPSWDELPTNQVAEYGVALSKEFNATDADTPPVVYTVNDTDFAMGSATGILTNNTYLSIGVYYLQLNASDSVSPANINSTTITVTVSDTTDPTVTWYNQTNSTGDEVDIDIKTRRLLNLTWNLTDTSPINISSCKIEIRVNDTTINSTDWYYENETLSSNLDADGWWSHSCVLAYNNSDNTSISIYTELPNTLYYRATSLAIPMDDILDNVTYTIYRDNIAMFKNSNVTIEANYIYVTKHYLNSKSGTKADARLWYCNKTYADDGWGDFRISPYCIIGALIPENETKEDGSNYFDKFGYSDENKTFGGIGITDPSYFITDSVDSSSATLGWELTGTSGHSGHSYTSDDYGVTWTLETDMEFDIIIQWANAMYFEARINITDNEGNTIVDMQTDYFDTINRAPEAAFKKDCDVGGLLTIYNECNISERGTLNISADFMDPDTNLVNCTFILLNNDSSYNQTLSEIETNTSYGVCSFQYDTTVLTNNDYYFKVNVTDGLLIGSDSTYDFVRIDNTDTNFELWNGSAWIDAYSEYMNFRCTPTQTYCEPSNQNSTQSIYKVTNNGTGSGTTVKMNVNESSPAGMVLFCNTSTHTINITETYQQIYGALTQSASVNIWCYMNYSNPLQGWFADTYAKVEY